MIALLAIGTVRFFSKSNEYRYVRVELTGREWWYGAIDPPPWLASEIGVGDTELEPNGAVSAEVVSYDAYPQGDEKVKFYPVIKLKGSYDRRSQQFIYKGLPVAVGGRIAIDLSGKKLLGIITHVSDEPITLPEESLRIRAIWRNRDPWIVAALKPGLTAINAGTGEEIARVLSVATQVPTTEIISYVYGGAVVFNKDPQKRDVVLELEIRAQSIGGVWSYAGHQKVKLGESLWVYTDTVDIEGIEITGLYPLENEE
ncbi:MAG: hypothetical protein A3A82_02790 [Candidatus Pacebacteria bacterium RIFCSPLOWO2_01_FULL_47_12]|nr:MAG: hypothetical protein A3J60_01640 [Candidatus Pacebacteria bacterium RIFCSPHIGHO2_02_FULL_46_9]OGJ37406.1 MAG: hypothetical protein A3A82_02790 [Candidatus Pacebacteria bacterium RIFCSPLOWO2_01_FULL_47_12]